MGENAYSSYCRQLLDATSMLGREGGGELEGERRIEEGDGGEERGSQSRMRRGERRREGEGKRRGE